MPGREDQLEERNRRARNNAANTSRPMEEYGKNPISAIKTKIGGKSTLKSFFGGNYDVYSKLESIEFQGILGDNSMRGSVAYIRVWRRGGSALSPSNSRAVGGGDNTNTIGGVDLSNPTAFYNTDLSFKLASNLNLPWFNKSNEPKLDWFSGDYSNNTQTYGAVLNSQFSYTSDNFYPQGERQKNLSNTTPTSSTPSRFPLGGFFGPNNTPQRTPAPFLQSPRLLGRRPIFIPNNPLGGVRSANPNGLTNLATRTLLGAIGFRESFPSYLSGPRSSPPPYSGGAKSTPSDSTLTPNGEIMWQFLFNPSELELEVGPEFKTAETWGVSDKANSGQPLHWSHNKNAQLKFNSVLLNGYIFGKKVEALEQGLLELFMARDGEGQFSPHVLEFVWGKRTFGPCVIKNINVKEKMWDEGEVVNAELSFTLEQIPEWTINDGAYVDVARPGRRPLREDPGQSTIGQGNTQTGSAGTTNQPSAGGGNLEGQRSRDTLSPQPNFKVIANKCQNLKNIITNLKRIQSSPNFLGISQESPAQAIDRLNKYRLLYDLATKFSITPINVGKSFSPDDIERQINKIWDDLSKNQIKPPGETKPKRLLVRYPFIQANALIASGVSFLIGNLDTQTKSKTCSQAFIESNKSKAK